MPRDAENSGEPADAAEREVARFEVENQPFRRPVGDTRPASVYLGIGMTKIIRISADDRDHYLDCGGIHGSELTDNIDPVTQDLYDLAVAKIIQTVELHGSNGIFNDSQYYIDKYAPATYFPCVEVKAERFVTVPLLIDLHQCVRALPQHFRLDVCNAFLFWNEEFNAFIEHDVVYWFSGELAAERIGIRELDAMPSKHGQTRR